MDQADSNKTKVPNIEDYEKYLLHSRGEIIQKLRQLAKGKNLLTGFVSNDSVLTAVLDVLPDNDLVVLDYASNETLNNKLLNAKRVIFNTQHLGITAQFTATNIKKARLKGNSVLACPIPETLLWVQRRESYRVRVPLSSKVQCEINLPDDGSRTFDVLDISTTGISISYADQFEYEVGDILSQCRLQLDEFGSVLVDLEIRNEIEINDSRRIGCMILNHNTDLSAMIQRYIHLIDSLQRKTTD